MTHIVDTSLGDLIAAFYEEFFALYGDEELASLATATVINEMLQTATEEEVLVEAA